MAADSASIFAQIDAQLEQVLQSWNVYTTVIAVILISYLCYPLFFYTDPDVHPLLLARQSSASQVRQPGESATFRSLEIPHGYPLRTGLNVKDPSAPKWSSGRDGDLRDVWKKASSGPVDDNGKSTGKPGKILTVLGKEEVIEHTFEKLTREVIAIGQHLKGQAGSRVAIYLPNSVELLVTLFAASFYGITPVLVPQEQSLDNLAAILTETKADVLVAAAGAVPLKELLQKYSNLKQMIWVVERTSRHMDWNEVPEGEGGKADVAVWHDIIDQKVSSLAELPSEVPEGNVPDIATVTEDPLSAFDSYDIVHFSQKNLVAAISAQISALPRNHRLSPTDLITPLASLTDMYPLLVTLAALFSNASLALTPVTGPKVPYSAAFQGASPTVVIAGTQTLSNLRKHTETASSSRLQLSRWWTARSLDAGTMPKISGLPHKAPRLIYTYDNASSSTVPLTPSDIYNLKLDTGARLVYAFTDSHVAGAVSQTNMLDYRRHHGASTTESKERSHFGPPLSCLEFKLKDTDERKNSDDKVQGQLVVSGPAVVGGEAVVSQIMTVTEQNTLSYL